MTIAAVKITIHCIQIQRDHARGVGAVDRQHRSALAGKARKRANWRDQAGTGENVTAEDQPGAGGESDFKGMHNIIGAVRRQRNPGALHDNAAAPFHVMQAVIDCAIFLVRGKYLVSGAPTQAIDHHIDSNGDVAGKRDVLRRRVDKAAQPAATFVHGARVFRSIPDRAAFNVLENRDHLLEDPPGLCANGSGVEIDLVGADHKCIANLPPIGFLDRGSGPGRVRRVHRYLRVLQRIIV